MNLINQWDSWCLRGLKGICDLLKERVEMNPFMDHKNLFLLKEEVRKLDDIYFDTTGTVNLNDNPNRKALITVDNCIIGGYLGLNNLLLERVNRYPDQPIEIDKIKRVSVLNDLPIMAKLIEGQSR